MNKNNYYLKGTWGLEKENLRVKTNGELSLTPHPKKLGNKLTHKYITTDFSESQVEIITPPAKSIDEAFYLLENLNDIVLENLDKDELLWTSSMPAIIPEDDKIPVANFGYTNEAILKMEYRDFIAKRYGKPKQLICGIHYNFSFDEKLIDKMFIDQNINLTKRDFKDNIYLKVARNILKHQWLITYFLGANVGVHSSYTRKEDILYPNACSFRNSTYGYRNIERIPVSFNSLKSFINDLDSHIKNGTLNSINEYYSPVRLKNSMDNNSTHFLEKDGIEYIELRMIDLNPLTKTGITKKDLILIHIFILYSLLKTDSSYEGDDQLKALAKINYVSINGRRLTKSLRNEGLKILEEIKELLIPVINNSEYLEVINDLEEKIKNPDLLYSSQIYNNIKKSSFIDYHLDLAQKHKKNSLDNSFSLKGYQDLELSTQILIKEALLRGLTVEILDRKENFISIGNKHKKEYIKQATKTSLDLYSTALIMENKAITKKILSENNISVPDGEIYNNKEVALLDYELYRNTKTVIKPNNTNFGIGITILEAEFPINEFKDALDLAFNHDETILIEKFFNGLEYRFTVINGEVRGILRRVPANITGDGTKTVRELIQIKNQDPLRGKGYITPLEKIKTGKEEEYNLKKIGLNFDSIPEKDRTIFLRENSNISTGGDSVDYTDEIPKEYKDEAIRAAKAVGACITGVDMIIKDREYYKKDNQVIIELNFNPAIHIHCYPYKGKNRRLGTFILDALGF